MAETRQERDSLGPVAVPAAALYGAHTGRALDFRVSGAPLHGYPELVRAFARVKVAAARANAELGVLAPELADAIVRAGREVAEGRWHEHFPLDVVQGGGGTATNMNVNEVLANRAGELLGAPRGSYRVHPNDHVNRSQSTNDAYPTALALAVIEAAAGALDGFEHVRRTLEAKAEDAGDLVRLGRTCLQDAVPLLARETHRAQAAAVARTAGGLRSALDPLHEVPLGATAVGTGIGAPDGYRELAVARLAEEAGLPLRPAPSLYDALANIDPLLAVASALDRAMLTLSRIAADLRLLSSGPVGGIGEVHLPAVLVGSSIMPGKVNPAVPELVMQIGYEIRGAVATIEAAAAAGELELNVMEPVVARHLLSGLRDSGRVAQLFADRCLAGLEWDAEAVRAHLAGSLAGAVERAAEAGYDAAAAERKRLT